MKNKNNVKKVSNIPYSNKYLVDELKSCLKPLFEQKDVVKKWSPTIPDFIKETKKKFSCSIEEAEESLFLQVNRKTYENLFKTITDSVSILIGKSILQQDTSNREVKKSIFTINDCLTELYNINQRLESWLYYDTDYANSEDYADLCDIVVNVKEKFNTIYENYNKMKFNITDLKGDNYWVFGDIKEIYSTYQKLLKLVSKIFELDLDDRLYPYSDILEDFSRNLANELIYVVGELYLLSEPLKSIFSKSKDKIEKYFTKLEEMQLQNHKRLEYLFYKLNENSNYGTKRDNELLYAYQELKAATNTMLSSHWRC